MNLDAVWARYESYSKLASEAARQLAFAGIAAIWIFKVDDAGAVRIAQELYRSGFFLVLALGCDFLQYVAGTFVFQSLGNVRERLKITEKRNYPHWILWPMDVFFILKLIAVLAGYLFLLDYLFSRIVYS